MFLNGILNPWLDSRMIENYDKERIKDLTLMFNVAVEEKVIRIEDKGNYRAVEEFEIMLRKEYSEERVEIFPTILKVVESYCGDIDVDRKSDCVKCSVDDGAYGV